MDLLDLSKVLNSASLTFEHQLALTVRDYAKEVEKEAKEEIGHYQQAVGPFEAWAPLAESTQEDRVRRGFSADEPELRTGELRDSIKSEASGLSSIAGSTSEVMLWQENGTAKMPPRAIIGTAYIRKLEFLEEELGRCVMRSFRAY
ncbi:hypothetical protein [Rouxiella badensis]|uniref:hypothetical protein n=1 Tax=Rouxiella badensis TaxID=1646377 RepID=UPI003C6A76B7